ncbi:hypothetical protein Tam10B_0577 [Bifidobacterium vansinderenii]|uniref:Sugar-binding protein n=2 Tax=Bifidobacterium vansinderenii TaxID=1984871 RepID=A0A229VZW8_9BIFI|nr:hypothetical protein Tam10B_0577 [Bifidobacterium vansinderenii]
MTDDQKFTRGDAEGTVDRPSSQDMPGLRRSGVGPGAAGTGGATVGTVGADVPMMADIPGSSVRSGMPVISDSHSVSGPVPISSSNAPATVEIVSSEEEQPETLPAENSGTAETFGTVESAGPVDPAENTDPAETTPSETVNATPNPDITATQTMPVIPAVLPESLAPEDIEAASVVSDPSEKAADSGIPMLDIPGGPDDRNATGTNSANQMNQFSNNVTSPSVVAPIMEDMVSDRAVNETADSPAVTTASASADSAISGQNADNVPSISPTDASAHAGTDESATSEVPTVVADSNTSAVDVPTTVTEAPTMVFSPSALADAAAQAAAKNGAAGGAAGAGSAGAGAKSTAPKSTSEWLYPDDAKAASARHGGDLVDTSWGIEPIQFPASVTGADDTDVDATKPFGDLPQFAGPASDADDFEHRDKPALAALAGAGFADDMVDEEKPEEKKKSPWIIVAIVVAILVVIGLVVGVFVYWNSLKKDGAHSDAMTQCIAANNRVTIANDKLSKALSSTKDAQGIAGDQVADANTVSTLKTAVEEAGSAGKAKSCTYLASTEQLTAAAKDNRTLASKLEKSVKSVTAAAKAVTDSKQQKEIDTAKQQLQDLLATAQQTMADSEGEVSDESTRTALQSAIDSANGVLANTDATVDDLNKAKTDLQSAIDAVTASMDEYQAALKAQQQKESSSDSDSNGSSNSNSNSGTTKRNSGSTTRRTTSPSTTHRNTTSSSPSASSSSPSTTTSTSPGTSGTEGSTDNSGSGGNGSGNGSGSGSGGSSTDSATGGTSGNGTTDNGTNSNNSGKTTTSN